MSCFMLDPAHLDAIVAAACALPRFHWYHKGHGYALALGSDSDGVLRMLATANRDSVVARYGEGAADMVPTEEEIAATSSHVTMDMTVDYGPGYPGRVFKLLDSYEYQACEHDGWKDSEARAFVESLRAEYMRRCAGYAEQDWELRSRGWPTKV